MSRAKAIWYPESMRDATGSAKTVMGALLAAALPGVSTFDPMPRDWYVTVSYARLSRLAACISVRHTIQIVGDLEKSGIIEVVRDPNRSPNTYRAGPKFYDLANAA